MTLPRIVSFLLLALVLSAPVLAQEHATPTPPAGQSPVAQGAEPAHPPAGEEHHEEESLVISGARLLNFAILVGVLVYFLRSPIAAYLIARSSQIRQDLVTAEEMRVVATTQLAEIDRRMQELDRKSTRLNSSHT